MQKTTTRPQPTEQALTPTIIDRKETIAFVLDAAFGFKPSEDPSAGNRNAEYMMADRLRKLPSPELNLLVDLLAWAPLTLRRNAGLRCLSAVRNEIAAAANQSPSEMSSAPDAPRRRRCRDI